MGIEFRCRFDEDRSIWVPFTFYRESLIHVAPLLDELEEFSPEFPSLASIHECLRIPY